MRKNGRSKLLLKNQGSADKITGVLFINFILSFDNLYKLLKPPILQNEQQITKWNEYSTLGMFFQEAIIEGWKMSFKHSTKLSRNLVPQSVDHYESL